MRRAALAALAAAGALLVTPAAARGQTTSPAARGANAGRAALDSLAAESARRTARYADRRAAVADGYRRIGADFPGMGEHWLHPAALLAGGADASRPTLLMYADVGGRPTLLGVGFVVTTRGDSAAPSVPGWPEAWHEHSGLLADESGARRAGVSSRGGATRVWVLHVWTALPNPNGPYVPDNWALPFARVGLVAPAGVDADAGRALSLVIGGDEYLKGVLADAGVSNARAAAAVDAALAASQARVGVVAARARAAGAVRTDDLAALRAEWRAIVAALRGELGAAVDPYLAPPHSPRGASGHHHAP